MNVVIMGGNGFVGRHLVAELQESWPGVRIIVWDTNLAHLPPGVTGLEVDIVKSDTYKQSLQETKPDFLVHLAAIASIPFSLKNPGLTHRVNVEGTQQLLALVRSVSPATRALVISSADIYGRGSLKPMAELALEDCHPQNPYATSKWEMEQMIEKNFNDMAMRVRPFPHIGPGQAKGLVTADFASQIAAIEQGKQEPIVKVGNLEARRDFTDVRDVVRAYRLLMEMGTLGEVYHVASGTPVVIQSILDNFLSLATKHIRVEHDPARMRPSDVPVMVGDAGKLRAATGWQPDIPLEQTLLEILDYWRENARTS